MHPFGSQPLAALALAAVPTSVSLVPSPAPKVMSVPLIDSLPVDVSKPTTNKGKKPIWGTWRTREDDSDIESTVKKHKVSKHLSKAIILDTEDEDGKTGGAVIFVKASLCLIFGRSYYLQHHSNQRQQCL
jgi:hypothetical protein